MALAAGTRLGPYEIQAAIDAGGMGEVYQARDTRLDRVVAVKVLPPMFACDPERRTRFEREAKTIAGLNHPHICTLHDVGEHEASMFLVMELLEGESLRAHLSHRRPAIPAIVEIGIELADALESAHGKGIVHRDLKPENIFITTRGAAKLLDFGIAKLVTEQAAATAMATETRVGTGPVALGTVAYMSPEQVRGETLDARTDLFSLGVVLYEMATGQRPFKGTTSGAVLGEILTKAPTAPVRLNSDVPPELERIVNKLLEKDRELRYQSAREVRVDLERVRRESATPTRVHATDHASPDVAPSIAVLPFVNMSGDVEQEYFSDGLAEEVINVLSRIPGLKVIARTSAFAFKGKQQDVRTIAQALGVTSILEGSVRRAGNRVRVTAQLVTAADGSHLWSDRYDRQLTDIFATQDDIAAAIAGALKVTLYPKATRHARHEPDPEAYESYLRAIYHLWKLSPEAVARSRECLERTISLDPKFALGHFGLAQHAWILASMGYLPPRQAMPLVREHTQTALNIDGDLAEAHAMLGIVAGSYDYDWQEAERRFRVALSYDPVPPNVRSWHAFFYLLPMGRADEAVEQARRGLAGDPLNSAPRSMLGSCLVGARRLEEAQFEASKILEFEETQAYACSILAASHAFQGRWSEALGFAERAFPRFWLIEGMHAGILRRAGQEERAEQLINKFMPGVEYGAPLALAWCYGLSGEPDLCADWIQKALDQRPPEAPHHTFILMRSHARWRGLAALMGITQPGSSDEGAPRPAAVAIGTTGTAGVEQVTACPVRPADRDASS